MRVMDRMRLSLVGPVPPPVGGMATQAMQLLTNLREEGYSVELIETNAPYQPSWMRRVRGLRAVARLIPFTVRLWRAVGRSTIIHVFANSGWAWWLFAVPTISISRLRRVPIVVNYHGGAAKDFFVSKKTLALLPLKMADAIVVPSKYLEKVFANLGVRTEIIPNVVDTTRFHPRPEMRDPEKFHIVMTRNLEPVYDIATALAAFSLVLKELPQAYISIAGVGPEHKRLINICENLGIRERVVFVGRIENSKIHEFYQSANLMLNSSLVDNQPVSILEAYAAGVPVVSTDVGGVSQIATHDRTALLVPSGDPVRMSEAILRIARDPDLVKRLTTSGLVEIRNYTWKHIRVKWQACYEHLTQGAKKRG